MSGGVFVGVEKYLIGGITDATKGLMMSYSSMMMGLAAASAPSTSCGGDTRLWLVSSLRRWKTRCGTS